MTWWGVGTNRFAYTANDPINYSDPNGNWFGRNQSREERSARQDAQLASYVDNSPDFSREHFGQYLSDPNASANEYHDAVASYVAIRNGHIGGESGIVSLSRINDDGTVTSYCMECFALDAVTGGMFRRGILTIFGKGVGLRVADDIAKLGAKISRQKQARHIKGDPLWKEHGMKGYLNSHDDAQRVLDATKRGDAQVIGRGQNGSIIVKYDKVTGFNNNPGAGYLNQPTNVFEIKGVSNPSVFPKNPNWSP